MGRPCGPSPTERFVSAEPSSDITTTSGDPPSLSGEEIDSLRDKSIRKLYQAIDEIILRYQGDGDEEADDVVDLELLEVVEDRGRIRLRFGSTAPGAQTSHEVEARLGVAKGKQRAVDGQAEAAEDQIRLLDATEVQADDEVSDSDSVIFLSSSHSCSSDHPPTSDCTRQGSSAPLSHSIVSRPDRRPTVPYPTDSLTNALFERLKKRVKERAADIRKHRIMKLAAARTSGDIRRRTPLSSSPHTSQVLRIPRPRMPNLPSPHLTLSSAPRLPSTLTSSTRTMQGTHAPRPHPLVDVPSAILSTPATTRTATCTNTGFSSHAPLGDSTSKKRHRDHTLPSSPYMAPCSSPKSLSVPSTSSSSEKAGAHDNCRKLIKPTRLFQTKIPPGQPAKPQKSRPKTPPVAPEQEQEPEGFSSESSEDPLYLPPSTSKKKPPHPCTTPTSDCRRKSITNRQGLEGLDDELALELTLSSSKKSKSKPNRSNKKSRGRKSRGRRGRNFT